ncbi:MAG: amino acid adenylation domain-containing protein, partial [Pseudomonadales bacterium]
MTPFPLTREQQGLWVEWKLSTQGISYNTCVQATLDGPVDPELFSHAIATVIARYQLLHGYCTEQQGEPVIALSAEPYSKNIVDVCDVSEGAEQETPASRARALAILNRKRDAAINLGEFPLVRSALVRSSAQRWYFIGVVPHIISDGYSAVFILQAISKIYNDGIDQPQPDAETERKDWSDYLQWRAEVPQQKHSDARDYWRDALRGAEHFTPISQRQAPATDTLGRRRYFSLDGDVTKRLGKLAFAQRTSLFSSLAALYAAFLYRRTDQQDILIAHPVDLRPPGYRDAFGFYVNIVPLRVDLSERPSFAELVRRIGATRRASKKHLHLPSLDIITAKRTDDPAFDGRLTNVSMGQTVSRFQGLTLDGIHCEPLDNDMIHVRDDLSLMYEVSETHIGLWFEYRQSQFSETDIDAMVGQMERLINAIDADPEQPIDAIDIVGNDEQQRLLANARGPKIKPAANTWNDAFQAVCRSHPTQIALQVERDGELLELSYQQLNAAAEQLHQQISVNDANVVVLLDRSPEQIVALLAILRSGNAYVPVDVSQPPARIAAIIADCNAARLITSAAALTELEESLGQSFQALHQPFDFAAALSANTIAPPAATAAGSNPAAEQLAYIIYTSGSTGTPKGVAVSHGAMQQRMAWLQHAFPLTAANRMLCNTSYAFDVSVAEMFWPLASGATLTLTDPDQSRDFRYMRDLIERRSVTTTALVPSALAALLEGPEAKRQLASLELVLAAGEALPLKLAQRFYQHCSAALVNVYGPTEATIYATCKAVAPTDQDITIGSAIANTEAYVLSSGLALTPQGGIGQLTLAGPGLAAGYLNQPELTAQRFVDHPYGAGRLYLTGDRARVLASGEIEFLGRSDDQIKLRGYRIELGDIAVALSAIDDITDAAVIIQQATVGNSQRASLIAYYSTRAASEPDSQWLREQLARQLPGYMIPNQFVAVASVPRLASGKLDRQRLPVDATPMDRGAAPNSAVEKAMATAWARALGVSADSIGLDSHFFELGGDSLLLIGLISELEQQGLYLDVHELFEHPTIATAAPLVRTEQAIVVDQTPVVGTWPALARHRKLLSDGFSKPEHWNRCIVVRFDRHLDAEALQASLNAIVAHHDGLRLTFEQGPQGPLMTHHAVADVPATVAHLDLTGTDIATRTARETEFLNALNASFKLHMAPLFKLAMIDTEVQSTVAIISHHLLIDMRSCQILMEDLLSGYQLAVSHRTIRLPAKTTSVGALSEALHGAIDKQWHREELPYWSAQLSGA